MSFVSPHIQAMLSRATGWCIGVTDLYKKLFPCAGLTKRRNCRDRRKVLVTVLVPDMLAGRAPHVRGCCWQSICLMVAPAHSWVPHSTNLLHHPESHRLSVVVLSSACLQGPCNCCVAGTVHCRGVPDCCPGVCASQLEAPHHCLWSPQCCCAAAVPGHSRISPLAAQCGELRSNNWQQTP